MHPLKLTLTILSLAGALLYTACRKTDQPANQPAPPGNEEQFFTRHASNLPRVQSIVQFMQRENDTYHFVNNLVKKAGYARWDKTLLYRTPSPQIETVGSGDTTFVAFIPMVLEGGNTVNAQLVVNISPADTLYRVIGASEYTSFGFAQNADTSLNALKLFSLFATHEKAVFNRTRFEILDNRILQGQSAIVIDTAKRYMVQLDTAAATFSEVMSAPEPELPHSSCITVFDMIEAGYSVVYNMVGTACIISSYSLPGGGGGGGTNGPAGGGGTVNPGPIGGGGTSGPIGWGPVPLENPPSIEPIDSLLKKAALLCNKYRDSLSSLCESQNVERFFNIVLKNNLYDTLRVVTGKSSEEVNPNYNIDTLTRKGEWHYHQKYPDGTPGSWPSGADITKMYGRSNGHIMIVDTYTARYALVVENSDSMTVWKNRPGNGAKVLAEKIATAVWNDPRATITGQVYVDMTKEKVLAALGSSSHCGIGLYQAYSYNSTSFIKVN